MYQIAKITFEAEIETHSQAIIEEFDFKSPKWYKNWKSYIKDEGLSRYTLQKIDKKLFVLGEWNKQDYPERENMIKEVLNEIEREFKCKINILKINRVST